MNVGKWLSDDLILYNDPNLKNNRGNHRFLTICVLLRTLSRDEILDKVTLCLKQLKKSTIPAELEKFCSSLEEYQEKFQNIEGA